MNGHINIFTYASSKDNGHPTPAAIKAELEEGMRKNGFNGMRTASIGAAILYFALSVAHLLVLDPPARWVMAPVAGVTGLLFLILARLVKTRPQLYRFSFPLWVFFFGLAQINSLLHLFFDPQPYQTTNLILVNIALGIALFSSRWAAGFYFVSTIAWVALAMYAPPSDQWLHFYFAYFQGLLIGVLVHIIRKRSVQRHVLKEIFLRQQNVTLTQARQAAEAAARAKAAFLASMSHELRTPLNSIIGYSEMIQADLKPHDQLNDTQQDVDSIHRAGRHLLSLINDVLNLAKIESEQNVIERKTVAVADVVEEVIQTSLPLIHKNNNNVSWPDVDEKAMMETDPLRLKQILLNLLANAAKFTRDGHIDFDVQLNQKNQEITFSIRDTGIGIEGDKLEHLFEPFWQGDSSFTRTYEGTGLGLAISDQLSRQLGGGIEVQSTIGQGSTFCVKLPLR